MGGGGLKLSVKRLNDKLTKENLWIYILAELVKRPMYAYEVAKAVKQKYMIPAATVTTYVVLYKMKREGLIEKKEKSFPLSRPARKYYGITEKGLRALEEGKRLLRQTLDVLG
ncbi:PadR family transcriptional regulator [Candidatus Hecatella orcuttiae]|uniref:PadR family transcriptional regulator n=1 Tax=Candidatus Hecatella orcuttiae TaxID=1935119 RepID=UPI002867D415|nr:PadR family transcriptional regulator [Candidatus Hecatella orcuttiae]